MKLAIVCLFLGGILGCGQNELQKPIANPKVVGCASNLQLIDSTKRKWAEAHGAGLTDAPTLDDLQPFTRHGIANCPEGGTYNIGKIGELPQCSIAAHNEYFKSHLPSPPNSDHQSN